jgi:uncharacterized protein YfaS (alpha-2-macroglobulin family)
MAPSFTLTFSYFLNGVYHSEGTPFTVDETGQQANINIQTASSVQANASTAINISTKDSANQPISTHAIVDIVSANSYDLANQMAPSIFAAFYQGRPIMTSFS